MRRHAYFLFLALVTAVWTPSAAPQASPLPAHPLFFGDFQMQFRADGTLVVQPQQGPRIEGTWTVSGDEIELVVRLGEGVCQDASRYRYRVESGRVHFTVIDDRCSFRALMFNESVWRPEGDVPPVPEREIVVTPMGSRGPLPDAATADGSWPAFRGPGAAGIADGPALPERWDGESGENVLWKTPLPGLGHGSPIVWGDRLFVTTAVSSDPDATFRPGLYGDGDASEDRSVHRWVVMALDKRSGERLWERVAFEGPPIDKRHIKSTYASATPATDGRVVVAGFGSQGLYAYAVDGTPLWKADLGRMDLGAYNVPTAEWGPASSPLIWNGRVFVQVDTHADSFVAAFDLESGALLWKTDRDEIPSWGTPNVVSTSAGPQLVTNASNFIRSYDPESGRELWRLGGSSKITAPTPIGAGDLIIVASGRAPERPIFAVRPGARGDLTLPDGERQSEAVAWSWRGRGSYMPTPLACDGILYVLANNGVFDAYDVATGEEIYRQRLPHRGSGFSASPVAGGGKIYLPAEDGEILVVRSGRKFEHIATFSMGEPLMATPAVSDGVMYVRSSRSVFAIGRR